MLENQSDPPQNCDRFWNLNARYDKSFKKAFGFSCESTIPYQPANNGGLDGKRVPSKGARERGFLEKPPQTLPAGFSPLPG